jgi:hypothetical protein
VQVTHRKTDRRQRATRGVSACLVLVVSSLMAAAVAAQDRPEELHGEVVGPRGDRIVLKLSQQEWVPHPGTIVELGAEMSGMWVPLKGRFAIVQVDADAVEAMPVGTEPHGTPAAGMKFVAKPAGYWLVRSRADIVARRQRTAEALPAAQAGDPLAQHVLAMGLELDGDHDNALVWWERAMAASNNPTVVAYSARGRAKILIIRQDATSAVPILEQAIARTTPSAHERGFRSYASDFSSPLALHIMLLMEIGGIHRSHLGNPDEATRWYGAAAELMSAAASSDTPAPGELHYREFQSLVMDLAMLYEHRLDNRQAAIRWLQPLARTGHAGAQSQLTTWGQSW